MSQTEFTPKVLHRYPEVEVGLDGIETVGERYEEWMSHDNKHKVTLSILGGGSWNSTWLKEIKLETLDEKIESETMKIQFSKNADLGSVCTSVYVEAVKKQEEGWVIETYAYSTDSEGFREDFGTKSKIGILETLERLAEGNLRTSDDLPERIDVEETARFFVEQLKERNFALPKLIDIS